MDLVVKTFLSAMFAIRRNNRFPPVDSSDDLKQGNTGLALTICEQPIEQIMRILHW